MTDYPSRDTFAEHLDSEFDLAIEPDANVRVKLHTVSDLTQRPPQEQFSIVFLAPQDAAIQQGVYDLTHPDLGKINLFLVPVALTEKGLELEAVFNFLST